MNDLDPADSTNLTVRKYHTLIAQFSRFFIVGLINTVIDYVILFSLVKVTGITSGDGIIPLNLISFSIATTNSYILNKYWAFNDKTHIHPGRKISMFLMVSIVGVIINTAIVRTITTNVDPLFNLEPTLWLLAAKVVATALSLIWNFTGYKLFVFKK